MFLVRISVKKRAGGRFFFVIYYFLLYAFFTERGVRGVRKPQNRTKICQITANRTEFYQKTETAYTKEGYRKTPPSQLSLLDLPLPLSRTRSW